MNATTASSAGLAERLARVAEGDPAAWEELCRSHADAVWRIAVRTHRHRDAAEDACQEVFLHLRRQAHRFSTRDGDAHAEAWLRRLAINRCLELTRKRQVRERVEVAGDVAAITAAMREPQDEQVDEALHAAAVHALAGLRESDQQLIGAIVLDGMAPEVLASEQRCTVNALRVRFHRALTRLRSRIALMVPVVALLRVLGGRDPAAAPADLMATLVALSTRPVQAADWPRAGIAWPLAAVAALAAALAIATARPDSTQVATESHVQVSGTQRAAEPTAIAAGPADPANRDRGERDMELIEDAVTLRIAPGVDGAGDPIIHPLVSRVVTWPLPPPTEFDDWSEERESVDLSDAERADLSAAIAAPLICDMDELRRTLDQDPAPAGYYLAWIIDRRRHGIRKAQLVRIADIAAEIRANAQPGWSCSLQVDALSIHTPAIPDGTILDGQGNLVSGSLPGRERSAGSFSETLIEDLSIVRAPSTLN